MKRRRKLNWILVFFMLVGMFTGVQIAAPLTVNASTVTLFSENFDLPTNQSGQGVETISNTGGSWSQSNSNRKAQLSTTKYSGSFSMKIYYKYSSTATPPGPQNCGATLSLAGGTANYKNINISYYRKSDALEPDSRWKIQWSTDNNNWNDIEVITANLGSTFIPYSATLPSIADNNAAFYLRFITDSASTNTANTCNMYIDDISVTGEPLTLSAPSGLTATPGNSQAALSWSKVTGADYYIVKSSSSIDGTYAPVDGFTNITGNQAVITGLTNGSTYYYKVSAATSSVESPDSTAVQVTPQKPQAVPPLVSAVTASLNNNKIDLSWNGEAIADDSSTGYLLEISKDGGAYVSVMEYTKATAAITVQPFTYSYTPAASGSYVFKVTGKAGSVLSGTSATSDAVNYVLPLAAPVLSPPALNNGVVALSWTLVPEAQFYDVNVMDNAGSRIAEKCINNLPAPAASANIAGLTDGAVYTFSVTAKRNTDTAVSNVSAPLTYSIPPPPSWEGRVFGSGVSTTNDRITVDSGNVIIDATGGSGTNGKISGSADGIAYYFYPLAPNTPFQLSATASVNTFLTNASTPNQVAFGLMLRKTVGVNGITAGHSSNFAAVGACNQRMQMFSRRNGAATLTTADLIPSLPAAGNSYDLRIIGTADNKLILCCNNQICIIDNASDLVGSGPNGEGFYIGLFAARNCKVTYSNISLANNANSIAITAPPAKTEYFQGENLDFTGLAVTATFSNNGTRVLNPGEYTVTGFNNAALGPQTVTVNYAGRSASFNVNVNALFCTAVTLLYTPAKTTYYLGDQFDPSGMVINGTFSSGVVRALTPSEYTISGFDSSTPGSKTVTLTLNSDPTKTVSFGVTIRPSILQSIEITRMPAKTIYYPGETLNLNGMVISAIYDDSRAILQSSEYSVDSSGFNTSAQGEKTVLISCKGKTVNLILTVRIRVLTGIVVTTLPKTTFYPNETFVSTGLSVSKAYDNGDRVALAASEYTIDSSSLDVNTPGVYNIRIVPADQTLAPISYPVTVRPQTNYFWNTVVFGQSVSAANNFVTASEPGTANGTITVTALTGGGKVTGAHDGISYYYTVIDGARDNFVLSADIKVIAFAKDTPDNQEAFGLMARDAIGSLMPPGTTQPVFSSNVAAIGGYRGKTDAFMRTGVTNSAGNEGTVMTATNWATPRPDSTNTYPNATYRLTLTKTNTGFTASLNGVSATSTLFYAPDNFNCQNPEMYVGFYTARLATIEVSNVSFSVSDTATDAPRVLPPPTPIAPALNVLSLANVSKTDYALSLMSNINGTVTIKQGENVIVSDAAVSANQAFTQNTVIAANGNTNFAITLTPDASQLLTSYNNLINNFSVTMRTYETPDGNIYVSPTGSPGASATIEDPLDIITAITYVKEGQTIYMRGGTYNRTAPVTIPIGNNGSAAGIKTIAAYNGEQVILDFGTTSAGFQLGGNYWHIKGINVTRAVAQGLYIGGSNNVIERCDIYANGDTGLQISRFLPAISRPSWPANNLVLNCESYDNRDASENNADGFAAKLTCGEGNVFRGCISHNNIDDGWDLYTKAETGPIGAVLIEDCIAYNNGTLTNGHIGTGDKNGFKLGGEGIAVANVVRNSTAFGNGASGFTSNSNPAAQAYDCISFDNTGGNIVFTTFAALTPQFVLNNMISYRSVPGPADNVPASALSNASYYWNGTASANNSGLALQNGNFVSLTPPLSYVRDANGNIIHGDFLKFISPTEAALKSLTVSQGTLSPVFSPNVQLYVVSVKNNIKDITITPTATSTLYRKLSINFKTVTSGAPYKATLIKGCNFFIITVTAQDGSTKKTYLLNVYRELDNKWKDPVKFLKELWDAIKDYWDKLKEH